MVVITYIDTAPSAYIMDHCAGPNEALVALPIAADDTYQHLLDGLLFELERFDDERFASTPTDDLVAAARAAFAGVPDMGEQFAPWLTLEEGTEEDTEEDIAEPVCAWFRIERRPHQE